MSYTLTTACLNLNSQRLIKALKTAVDDLEELAEYTKKYPDEKHDISERINKYNQIINDIEGK